MLFNSRRPRLLAALVAALALGATAAPAAVAGDGDGHGHGHRPGSPFGLRLIGVNDFHGNLQPPAGNDGLVFRRDGSTVPAGGAAYLATHVKQLRRQADNSLLVGVGDLIGASPLESALFHDEPTIDLMNQLGMAASSVGNHEFDKGYLELQRMQHGGCSPVDGCRFDPYFQGAHFPYLGANVKFENSGRDALPPYWIRRVNGVPVGFIGEPLTDTPNEASLGGTAGLTFQDEVQTANRYADRLNRAGVKTIILLLHQGDNTTRPNDPETCDVASGGPAHAIAEQVSPKIDAVFSAHTHQQYVCWVDDPAGHRRPLIQGSSYGRELAVTDLRIDPRTKDVLRDRTTAFNQIVTRDVPQDPEAQALVARAVALAAPIANKVVGRITADIPKSIVGESAMGDVVADAELEATTNHGAQVALVDPGDVRAELTYHPPNGEVTYGEAFNVLPFDNTLVTLSLTGSQLKQALEQGFPNRGSRPLLLDPSANMEYTWSQSAPDGSKITSITINGQPVQPNATYRVTVNEYLAGGGDGFTAFTQGANRTADGKDLAALTDYLGAHSPVAPPPLNRIHAIP